MLSILSPHSSNSSGLGWRFGSLRQVVFCRAHGNCVDIIHFAFWYPDTSPMFFGASQCRHIFSLQFTACHDRSPCLPFHLTNLIREQYDSHPVAADQLRTPVVHLWPPRPWAIKAAVPVASSSGRQSGCQRHLYKTNDFVQRLMWWASCWDSSKSLAAGASPYLE